MSVRQVGNNFGLALSGGGFRATLFHLGVVRALAEAGLLSRVTHITSVSGGSVLSAHLVLNWKAYAGSSDAYARAAAGLPSDGTATSQEAAKLFDEASKPLLSLINLDIRNRILRRLPISLIASAVAQLVRPTIGVVCGKKFRGHLQTFSENRRIVEQLGQHFEILFRDAKLCDLAEPDAPHLVILVTEVATMRYAWFSRDGFAQPGSNSPVGRDILTVARSVAASAAFPALFPPMRIDGEEFQLANLLDSFVTDAGVYDNLGISGFLGHPFEEDRFPVLVSDATATSEWTSTNIPNLLTNLLRSVDIMQQRAAQLQRDKAGLPQRDARAGNAGCAAEIQSRFVLFDIAQEQIREEPKIGDTAQQHVSYLRTDFDAFSADETRALVHHGYSVAWHTMKERGHIPDNFHSNFETWRSRWPTLKWTARDEKQRVDLLREGRKARLRLLSFSDPVGMICVLTVLGMLLLAPATLLVQNITFRVMAQRERLQVAKSRIESFQEFSFEAKLPTQHDPLPPDHPKGSFAGVTITSFEKLFDLRNWQPVPPELVDRKAVEPALQQTIYTVRRIKDAKTITFTLKTTNGLGIEPEVPTLGAKLFQQAQPGDYFPKQVLVSIDLDRIPPDIDYPVIVRATYWNGFQNTPIETAGFKTYTNGELGKMVILFPKNRLPKRFAFWCMPPELSKKEPMPVKPFYLLYKNGLYFEVNKPRLNYQYGIEFTWADESTGPMDQVTPALSSTPLTP